MALAEELPIYKATYDLVLIIFRLVKNFNREYKYTLGESIKKETIKAITNIYRANMVEDKTEYIAKARENVEIIRLYVRLLKDLHQITVKQLVYVNGYIENISKQLTGWQKSQKKIEIIRMSSRKDNVVRVTLCHALKNGGLSYGKSKRTFLIQQSALTMGNFKLCSIECNKGSDCL